MAKINLDLRVLQRNTDGFHELRTVFHTVSLADTIEIEFETARRTSLTLEGDLAGPGNLILLAARAALDEIKVAARVRFRLTKKIPVGAGLGGGSSNAAAVLLALPVLAGKAWPMEQRYRAGAALGSDVPFFLSGGAALGIGRGTELYPLSDLAPAPLLIVAPEIHSSTAAAYRELGRNLTFKGSSSSIVSFQAYARALEELRSAWAASGLSANDFESAVFRLYPQLKTFQAKLWKAGAAGARMTGSGSAIFAILPSSAERERVRKELNRDRVFETCRLIPAALVSRRRYQQLWRRQLKEHSRTTRQEVWPPPSRYER